MAAVDLSENNGSSLVAAAVSFLALTYFSVLLRIYVRTRLTNGMQLDDWLMMVAQVNFTLSCGFILRGVARGLGKHNKAVDQYNEIRALKWQALATATYITNMMFIKLSIAVFLVRLAPSRRYKWILWISMGIITVWTIVAFMWDIFQCKPVEAQWDFTIPNLKCVTPDEIVNAAYALSVMTILSDWLYALLPIPMIWGVKMSKQAKITVVVILGLGVFASVATLIRLKFLADLNDIDDILFQGTDAMVWTLVEPGVAIVAASLVTIRPLLRKMRLPGFTSAESRMRGTGGRSTGRMGTGGGVYGQGTNNKDEHGNVPALVMGDLTRIDVETAGASKEILARQEQQKQAPQQLEMQLVPPDRQTLRKSYLNRSLPPSPTVTVTVEEDKLQPPTSRYQQQPVVRFGPAETSDRNVKTVSAVSSSLPSSRTVTTTVDSRSGRASRQSLASDGAPRTGKSEVFLIEGPRESEETEDGRQRDHDDESYGYTSTENSPVDEKPPWRGHKKQSSRDPFADEAQ